MHGKVGMEWRNDLAQWLRAFLWHDNESEHHVNYQLIGLGDLVANWLTFFGINKWPGCGCDRRQKFLNQWQVVIWT